MKFFIHYLLGQGSFGRVYLVSKVNNVGLTSDLYALKVLKIDAKYGIEYENFNEINIGANIDSPYIGTPKHCFLSDDYFLYELMEYIPYNLSDLTKALYALRGQSYDEQQQKLDELNGQTLDDNDYEEGEEEEEEEEKTTMDDGQGDYSESEITETSEHRPPLFHPGLILHFQARDDQEQPLQPVLHELLSTVSSVQKKDECDQHYCQWVTCTKIQTNHTDSPNLWQHLHSKKQDKTNNYNRLIQFLSEDCKIGTNAKEWKRFTEMVTSQCLHALSVLHDHGYIHGDLKMENIMFNIPESIPQKNITTNRRTKTIPAKNKKITIVLIDFGHCKRQHRPYDLNDAPATIEYRSPEFLFNRAVFNPTVDVWSLGITLGSIYMCMNDDIVTDEFKSDKKEEEESEHEDNHNVQILSDEYEDEDEDDENAQIMEIDEYNNNNDDEEENESLLQDIPNNSVDESESDSESDNENDDDDNENDDDKYSESTRASVRQRWMMRNLMIHRLLPERAFNKVNNDDEDKQSEQEENNSQHSDVDDDDSDEMVEDDHSLYTFENGLTRQDISEHVVYLRQIKIWAQHLPPWLIAFWLQMLIYDPHERPTVHQLIKQFQRYKYIHEVKLKKWSLRDLTNPGTWQSEYVMRYWNYNNNNQMLLFQENTELLKKQRQLVVEHGITIYNKHATRPLNQQTELYLFAISLFDRLVSKHILLQDMLVKSQFILPAAPLLQGDDIKIENEFEERKEEEEEEGGGGGGGGIEVLECVDTNSDVTILDVFLGCFLVGCRLIEGENERICEYYPETKLATVIRLMIILTNGEIDTPSIYHFILRVCEEEKDKKQKQDVHSFGDIVEVVSWLYMHWSLYVAATSTFKTLEELRSVIVQFFQIAQQLVEERLKVFLLPPDIYDTTPLIVFDSQSQLDLVHQLLQYISISGQSVFTHNCTNDEYKEDMQSFGFMFHAIASRS